MELWAVIAALEAIKINNQNILIHTDSKYVVDAIEKKWLHGWITKNFLGKKNKDLWLKFWNLYNKHNIKFCWVKGHSGHPQNEKCDSLAINASFNSILLKDEEYEKLNFTL
jgi:ribonuclease HI